MPIGTVNIFLIPPPVFKSAQELARKIYDYFIYTKGDAEIEGHQEKKDGNKDLKTSKLARKEKEPATFAGLAFFLGFASIEDFDRYLQKGRFARIAKRGCLYVESVYEKKLHQQAPAGAIFVLKTMGWQDKTDGKLTTTSTVRTWKIQIIETGPTPVGNEKEVILE